MVAMLHQIEIGSGLIRYLQAGSGPPLVLLHGWGGSSRYWAQTIEALASSHTIYAPDLPGYGKSPPLPDKASSERLAEVVIEFADAMGIETFDLNGHSFSAGVAAYVASWWPERVHHLVLTCFSTFRTERERVFIEQMHKLMGFWMTLRQPWMGQIRTLYRTLSKRFFYRVPNDDVMLRQNFDDFLRMDKRTALESAASAVNVSVNDALQTIVAPTLLIGARNDAIMPSRGTPFAAQLIPNCQLVWIEQCGHLPMLECPDIYNAYLHDFLVSDATMYQERQRRASDDVGEPVNFQI